MAKVIILPIGQVDMDSLQVIQHGLRNVFPRADVTVSETVMPIPPEAYNSSRSQCHSTYILAKMGDYSRRTPAEHVLGVTEADLYVPSLNFVFGEAQCPGKVAIVSLFRLKPEFYGKPSNSKLFLERALKEVVHEIGHTFGLGHCKNPLCVMFFSNTIQMTDRKDSKFCEKCNQKVLKAL